MAVYRTKHILFVFIILCSTLSLLISPGAALAAPMPLPNPSTTAMPSSQDVDLPDFAPFAADDDVFSLLLPEAWEGVRALPWVENEQEVGTLVAASPDLPAFYGGWETPGIEIGLSRSLVDERAIDALLAHHTRDFLAECQAIDEYESTSDLSEEEEAIVYTTQTRAGEACAGTDAQGYIIAATPESGDYLLFILVKIIEPIDEEILDSSLESLAIGDLSPLSTALDVDAFVEAVQVQEGEPTALADPMAQRRRERGISGVERQLLVEESRGDERASTGTPFAEMQELAYAGEYEQALALLEETLASDETLALERADELAEMLEGVAGAAYTNGDYEEALAWYSRAIEFDPTYMRAYRSRALAHTQLGEYEEAIADYTTAIELDEPYYDYTYVYSERGARYLDLDEYELAIEDFTTIIDRDAAWSYVYAQRGAARANLGLYEEAIEDLTTALEQTEEDDDYQWVYANRGFAHTQLGEYERALDDFDAAIELDPSYTYAYDWRGFDYLQLDRCAEAVADFSEALALDEAGYDYKWVYANRGYCQIELGDYEQAIDDLSQALDLDPDYAWAYQQRSRAYGALAQYDEALADLTIATEVTPENASAWNSLCWYSSLYGFADQVVDNACEEAIALASAENLPFYRDSRGLARALTGDVDGAIEDFEAFLSEVDADEMSELYDLRESWVERLAAGDDPAEIFDAEMIETLLNE